MTEREPDSICDTCGHQWMEHGDSGGGACRRCTSCEVFHEA